MNNTNHKKRKKWLLIISIAIVVLVAGAAGYIFYNAEKIIRNNLSEYIYQHTDKQYRLHFNKLDVELRHKRLSISDIKFEPTRENLSSDSTESYFFYTELLEIDNINILSILSKRQFRATKLTTIKPDLRLNTGEKVSMKKLSDNNIVKGDTISIPFFSEVFFDTLRFSGANMNIDTLFAMGDIQPVINLEATHFKIGGIKYTETPYPFDISDLKLVVENLHKKLPDSVHSIQIERIDLSLLTNIVNARNVQLKPLQGTENIENNRFTVAMPHIKMNVPGISYLNIADTLHIESMDFENTDIAIKFGNQITKGTPINEINFFPLIENSMKWVSVGRFSFTNSKVKLIPPNTDKPAQIVEGVNLTFYNFLADSSSYKNRDRILSAQNIKLEADKFTLNHIDNIHRLTIEKLDANSATHSLSTGKISFAPVNDSIKTQTNTTVNVNSEQSVFSEIDFRSFYHDQKIEMEKLQLSNPHTTIGFEPRFIRKQETRDKSIILEKTRDYLKGIYVDRTIISNGTIQYNYITETEESGFFSTVYNFELQELSVDSSTFYQTDKIFFAEQFNLLFSDIELQLADKSHMLFTDSLRLSSLGQKANAYNLTIKPIITDATVSERIHSHEQQLNLEFPKIELSGAKLHQAFFYKNLSIDNFTAFKPVINFKKYGVNQTKNTRSLSNFDFREDVFPLIADYMNVIQIGNLNLKNGVLNFTHFRENEAELELSNQFSIKMYNFEIDAYSHQKQNKLFFSDDIILTLEDQSFTFADEVHHIDAKEIGINTMEKRIYINNSKLYPDILSDKFNDMPLSVFANIPSVEISNASILDLFNKGRLPVDHVKINNPDIRLLVQDAESNNKSKKVKPALILEGLHSLSSKKIEINNGKLKLEKYSNHTPETILETDANIVVDNLKIAHDNGNFSTSYHDFGFRLNNSRVIIPDSIHSVNIGEIRYNHLDEQIGIKNITLKPQKNKQLKKQYFNLSVPELNLSGVNLLNAIETQKIDAYQLSTKDASLIIDDKRIEKTGKFSPYNLELYQKISPLVHSIKLNSAEIFNSSFTLKNSKLPHLENIDLQLSGFSVDSTLQNAGKLLNSNHTRLMATNFAGKTSNGFYNYSIDKFSINNNGKAQITNFSLLPVYSEKEYMRIKQYEADYNKIKNADINLNNIDLQKYFDDNIIDISSAEINIEYASIHRDKTYSLHPDQAPPMPQEALRDLKQKINIGQVEINVPTFEYTELMPGATRKSYIKITDINTQVSNITNIDKKLNDNRFMPLHIEGYLMGEGRTEVDITFDNRSLNNEFTFKATSHEMPLNIFNPITEPGMNLSIKEGINRKLTTSFEANGDSAIGTMRFMYNDLKISVLNTKDGVQKEGKFVSFLINTMALKSDNPKRGNFVLPVKYKNHRNKRRSVVGYCWRSIFAGMKATLGLKEDEEGPQSGTDKN
ncbi:MAG: hypothetical protein K9G70_10555 [Prolixibacteraceae bacterium]|nr:hypothetical protein [Prolixibacteraceae bacterium]